MAYRGEGEIESILAIDCGSTLTQAVFIARVRGDYRCLARGQAPGSAAPAGGDVMLSVHEALRQVCDITGRPLTDDTGRLLVPEYETGGVDTAVITVSAGEPLRLVLSGIMSDWSLASARRAAGMSGAAIEGLIAMDGRDGAVSNYDAAGQARLIQDRRPDAIIIAGGTDGGAGGPVLGSVRAVVQACVAWPQGTLPRLIYAGNRDMGSRVAELAGAAADVRVVDNVRPGLAPWDENLGPLDAEIDALARALKLERVPGLSTLAAWSPARILPTSRALAHTMRYLARLDAVDVLAVDVGGSTASLISVTGDRPKLCVRTDLGLGANAARILDHGPVESITRWLPFEMDGGDVREALRAKAAQPGRVPGTLQEVFLEQAVAREVIRQVAAGMAPASGAGRRRVYPDLLPPVDLIVGGGGALAGAPARGQAALMLLDALQPIGLCSLQLDAFRLLAPIGAVAAVHPLAAARLAAGEARLRLGTVVAPVGSAPPGERAVVVKVEYLDGRYDEVEVPAGSLRVIPLPAGRKANLELRPSRHVDVVGHRIPGQAARTRSAVEGGVLGIIIDARGRPLPIAADAAQQRENVRRWLAEVGG